MAVELCDLNLQRYPGDGNFLCLAARANLALRNFAAADAKIEEAIRRYPDFGAAYEVLGDLRLVTTKYKAARAAYETAMRLDPTGTSVHSKLDRLSELEQSTPRPDPERGGARRMRHRSEIERARELEEAGDAKAAEMIYREILTRDPDHVEAARLLAGIAVGQKQFRDAEVFLERAVELAPDYVRAWADLTNVRRELDKLEEAVESAARVVELAPDSSESHVLYASAIGMMGDHAGAIAEYRRALEQSPERPAALSGMAHHQKTIGRQADAIDSYRRAIAAKPDHTEAYWSLANLKTFRFEQGEVDAMTALLDDPELAPASRAHLHNALGFEFEARGEYGRAYEHFERCNRNRRLQEAYDPVDTETMRARLAEIFTPAFLEARASDRRSEVTPILIVGLPRSGSTLVEQILASHSQVDGTHELGDLARAVQSVRRQAGLRDKFPDVLEAFGPDEWLSVGEIYLERTAKYRRGAPLFIDKNPNNFIYVGLMKLALPDTRIIDARRHPLDSCLGSFKQLFASGQPFTYDATELAEYYLQYDALMSHWHSVLPGYVLDVHYEDVVADLESQTRRMLDFCGLDFEPACLEFFKTDRAVKTASSEQVRLPIYASSVDRWRSYEPFLGEMIRILQPLLESLPAQRRPAVATTD